MSNEFVSIKRFIQVNTVKLIKHHHPTFKICNTYILLLHVHEISK